MLVILSVAKDLRLPFVTSGYEQSDPDPDTSFILSDKMEYHTVFDVIQNGVHWLTPFVVFVAAALFLLIGWVLRQSGEGSSLSRGLLFQAVAVIGMLGALVFFASAVAEYRTASKLLNDHRCSVVEGVVADYVPMPPGGHATESFCINGLAFSYGGGWGSTYFNSEWNSGLLHDGVHARITYFGADILKVEIR